MFLFIYFFSDSMKSDAFTQLNAAVAGPVHAAAKLGGKRGGRGGEGVRLKVITAASSASAACRSETKNKHSLIQTHAPPL